MIVYEILLAGFKFGDFLQNREFAGLKPRQSFPQYSNLYRLHTYIKLMLHDVVFIFIHCFILVYIDNKVYDNRRTLEEAIEMGKCLYSISGDNSYPMHDFYRCLTCESSESDAICVNCVHKCHKNHQVQFVRHDRYVWTEEV